LLNVVVGAAGEDLAVVVVSEVLQWVAAWAWVAAFEVVLQWVAAWAWVVAFEVPLSAVASEVLPSVAAASAWRPSAQVFVAPPLAPAFVARPSARRFAPLRSDRAFGAEALAFRS
jgi:hypothetical protein